jgi:hypothetical protein
VALNKTGESFIDASSRDDKTVRLLFSGSALRYQQRFHFNHVAICPDARRFFSRHSCFDCGDRRIGEPLAIFVGASGGPDPHCASLVSDRAFCGGADAIPAGTVSAEHKHHRNVDGDCFCFTSCFHVHRVAGRWFDGAHCSRGGERARRRLVSSRESRWHRNWRGSRRVAGKPLLEGDSRRVPIAGNAGRRVGAILRVRRTPGYNGNNQATAALVRPRHLFHVALADSAIHHRFDNGADRRRRDE